MSIITISRGSYSRGREVAEKVAARLGYECLSRDVILEASEEFNVPEIQLVHAIRDAPSFLERFTFAKERYLAYIRAALLDHFQRDNIVYHGLAGHFLVKNVSHVLKVRIRADIDDRVRILAEREGVSEAEALRTIRELDEARRNWSLYMSGVDTHDPSLYDMVIHIGKLTADDATDIICHTVQRERFQPTEQSRQVLRDLLLAARVRAALVESYPRTEVSAEAGVVYIGLEGATAREEREVRDAAGQVPGVERIEVRRYPLMTPD